MKEKTGIYMYVCITVNYMYVSISIYIHYMLL